MFTFAIWYLLDLRLIRGRERVAASVSVSSIVLPLSLGVGLGTASQPSSRASGPPVRAVSSSR
jgi:hypothetical protein